MTYKINILTINGQLEASVAATYEVEADNPAIAKALAHHQHQAATGRLGHTAEIAK